MQPIAHVKEVWRYPVKSMGGELLESATLTPSGLVGDRLWAVLDADGEIKSARQWPGLIQMTARYVNPKQATENCYASSVPDVLINTPDGNELRTRSPDTNKLVGDFLGHDCQLGELRPASDTDFYTPPKERNVDSLDQELDKLEDEGDFDFSQTPAEIFDILGQYMTPPGTFFDTFPLHMLSTQSLAYLGENSDADANRMRFRPNILLDFLDPSSDKPEFDLLNKRIRIGDAAIKIRAKTIRCSIPSRPQPLQNLQQDPKMTRAMVDLFERHVGVYANIEVTGEVKAGDAVYIDRS